MALSESGDDLVVESLAAGYLGSPVVREISLSIRAGEIVALFGPNGAGKTTTLMAISGLIQAMGGEVSFAGQTLGRRPAFRRARLGISLVPEGRALFPDLTAREHLKLAARRGRRKVEAETLALLPELEKCLPRKAGVLSGGEQQMLALGRALVSRPRALLVDEMSLGLAPVIVERLMPVLRHVADEYGTAVLFVEQHVAAALEIADRAYVLSHGRLVHEGPSDELRRDAHLLEASYLGEGISSPPAKRDAPPRGTGTTRGDDE
jgi:branched-chain amino acid transport system ATP-binding protein